MGLVMIGGSLVAGSTPMGGGAVSFPILVYAFGMAPEHARSFGLAIQAVGMTSALVFIAGRRTPVQSRLLISSCIGATIGIALGTFFVGNHVPRIWVKLLFACVWMSFAALTLLKNREICSLKGKPVLAWNIALETGLPIGVLGGLIASMIGVGLEMVIYTVLVLAFRCDLKVAIPTAVCATAVTSIIGVSLHIGLGDIPRAVVGDWMAAAPIVLFGAPAGAYVASIVSRVKLLYFVSSLCVFQFVWALKELTLSADDALFVGAALAVATGGSLPFTASESAVLPCSIRRTRLAAGSNSGPMSAGFEAIANRSFPVRARIRPAFIAVSPLVDLLASRSFLGVLSFSRSNLAGQGVGRLAYGVVGGSQYSPPVDRGKNLERSIHPFRAELGHALQRRFVIGVQFGSNGVTDLIQGSTKPIEVRLRLD